MKKMLIVITVILVSCVALNFAYAEIYAPKDFDLRDDEGSSTTNTSTTSGSNLTLTPYDPLAFFKEPEPNDDYYKKPYWWKYPISRIFLLD